MPVLKGKLLLPLLGALLLVGCQTSPPKPEAQVVEKPRPVQRSLEQRWQDSANRKQELESLISRLQGAELRKHARKGAASPATLEKTLARLEQARRYTRQARDIVSALYGYRKAGGAAFETRWEQALWKRLGSSSKSADSTPSEVNELDLLAARRSLAAQIAKAWFYEKGVRQLRQRADEVRDLYQQVLDRHRTSKQLERGNHDGLLATRKELARVDGRARQLQRAERLAHKALVVLTGNKGIRVEQKASVKPVPGGLPMPLLANRPDVYRSASALVEGGAISGEPAQLLPELPLTSKGGRPTRTLSRWSRYKPEKLQEALNLPSGMEVQGEELEAFLETLVHALREVRGFLHVGRQLLGQRSNLQSAQQEARRQVNKLRARYSARRADLTDILKAQIELAEIAGKLAYVQNRVFGQRLDSYLALGGSGF
ncbi:MAG: hypothetical protein DSZ01_07475 [Gammaproteobacteria bacterium]|nr:MAG: hypothetical protein DSZ01_07475 [Gammaproteobacteria bacterium]